MSYRFAFGVGAWACAGIALAGCGGGDDAGPSQCPAGFVCTPNGVSPSGAGSGGAAQTGSGGSGAPLAGTGGSDTGGSGGSAGDETSGSDADAGSPTEAGAGGSTDAEPCDSPGELRCAGAAQTGFFTCTNGYWVESDCDRGFLCDNESASCQAVAVDCVLFEPGDAFCDGTTRVECGPDLVSVEETECDDACEDGECVSFECGDGTVNDAAEECDDANDVETDECLSSCKLATCGDGIIYEGTEDCDDANAIETDDCPSDCKAPTCGDGFVWEDHEDCDDANDVDDDACPSNCKDQVCGDSYIVTGIEDCDDGNGEPADGCSATCRTEVKSLELGAHHSCAILHDGRLKCWGSNQYGELGFGQIGTIVGDSTAELGANLPTVFDGPVTAVSAGDSFTCAIREGALYCWGDNSQAQLGRGLSRTANPAVLQPGVVDLGGTPTSVCTGLGHACAVLENGDVKCWGLNDLGQTSQPRLASPYVGDEPGEMGEALPVVPLEDKAKMVGCGVRFSCALLENHKAYCWGEANSGQVGPLDVDGTPTPQLIEFNEMTIEEPAGLAIGGHHGCAWEAEGEGACWGNGTYGQRASGNTVLLGRPPGGFADWPRMSGVVPKVHISAGAYSTCVLDIRGEVACWGQDQFGMLGIAGRFAGTDAHNQGDDENENAYPVRFVRQGPQPLVRAVAAGDYHACAILDTGNVHCWGKNLTGQLAIGDIEAPNDIIGDIGTEWTAIANIH